MSNLDYAKSILNRNDIIIIDTSVAMDYVGFKKFVDQIELPLLEVNKNIIVPKVVLIELKRHLNSNNKDKQIKARHAIDIIYNHRNIFMLENEEPNYDEIVKAFADAELLSDLIKNKVTYNQLLITNDKKLSFDAFNLNNQESCKGRRVNVCFVTNNGNLKTCECVYNNKPILEPIINKTNLNFTTSLPEEKEFELIKVGLPVVAFIAGALIGKNHRQLLKFIKIGI